MTQVTTVYAKVMQSRRTMDRIYLLAALLVSAQEKSTAARAAISAGRFGEGSALIGQASAERRRAMTL